MNKPAALTELLERKQLLYQKLLDCSIQQLSLVERINEPVFLPLFEQSSVDWNSTVKEIEKIQGRLINEHRGHLATTETIENILQQIADNLKRISKHLREHEGQINEGKSSISNQKKIMNAYYGSHLVDSASIYFDEKK